MEVTEMSVQSASKLPVPSFCLYCHLSSAGVPVTEEAMVSSPLPAVVAVGLLGLPGKVLKVGAVIRLVAQALSV